MKARFLILLPALALASCATVGPDYHSPAPAAPAQSDFIGAASPAFAGDEPPGRWWSLFQDPVLDRLVEQALAENRDLRVAAANLAQARAVLRETRAGRLPSTNVSGGAGYGDQPGPGGAQATFDAGLDIGYQLDLFGRVRRAIEASRADADAVQAAFDLTRVTVAAETARAYADACNAGRQLAVARESVRIQEQTFDLTRRRFEGGRGTALDTNQAGALLEQSRAAIPTLEAMRQTSLYRLSVLTGRPPAEFPQEVAACATPPSLAFELQAVDYLLKPVGDDSLGRALNRVRERLRPHAGQRKAETHLAIRNGRQTDLVPVDSIDYVEVAGHYLCLRVGRETHLLREPLAAFAERIEAAGFVRCHRSALVRTAAIAAIVDRKNGDGEIRLSCGATVPLSRTYRDAVIARLALRER